MYIIGFSEYILPLVVSMHLEPGRLGLECFVNVFICLTKVHIEKTIVMVNVNQIYMIVINVYLVLL